MKVSKKYFYLAAMLLTICIGAVFFFREIHIISNDSEMQKQQKLALINERYDELREETVQSEDNTVYLEGVQIIIGKTTVQEFIDESDFIQNKSSFYYYGNSGYYYDENMKLDMEDIPLSDNIEQMGSGTVEIYMAGYSNPVDLTYSTGVWIEGGSGKKPDLSECYIDSVNIIQGIDGKQYQFSYYGIDETMDYDDIVEVLGEESLWYSYSGDGYQSYQWYPGREGSFELFLSYKDSDNTELQYRSVFISTNGL
jgi:hypothetical protein